MFRSAASYRKPGSALHQTGWSCRDLAPRYGLAVGCVANLIARWVRRAVTLHYLQEIPAIALDPTTEEMHGGRRRQSRARPGSAPSQTPRFSCCSLGKVKIDLLNPNGQQVVSDGDGEFAVKGLAASTYQITATKEGLATPSVVTAEIAVSKTVNAEQAVLNQAQALSDLRQQLGYESVPAEYDVAGEFEYQPLVVTLEELQARPFRIGRICARRCWA